MFVRGSGVISVGNGADTIAADEFMGTMRAGSGHDSISIKDSSALFKLGRGNDTIAMSGGATVQAGAGHDDFVVLQNSKNNIVAGGTGHDTFEYQYSDFSNEALKDGAADSKSAAFGALLINHFTRHDVLNIHDLSGGGGFTQTEVNANATVRDGGLHHNVTIVFDTAGGAGAGTIVLAGIGTHGHHLTSIDALISRGYHLAFS
jgi:hypothetical protein